MKKKYKVAVICASCFVGCAVALNLAYMHQWNNLRSELMQDLTVNTSDDPIGYTHLPLSSITSSDSNIVSVTNNALNFTGYGSTVVTYHTLLWSRSYVVNHRGRVKIGNTTDGTNEYRVVNSSPAHDVINKVFVSLVNSKGFNSIKPSFVVKEKSAVSSKEDIVSKSLIGYDASSLQSVIPTDGYKIGTQFNVKAAGIPVYTDKAFWGNDLSAIQKTKDYINGGYGYAFSFKPTQVDAGDKSKYRAVSYIVNTDANNKITGVTLNDRVLVIDGFDFIGKSISDVTQKYGEASNVINMRSQGEYTFYYKSLSLEICTNNGLVTSISLNYGRTK